MCNFRGGITIGKYVWRKSAGTFIQNPELVLSLYSSSGNYQEMKVVCNDVDFTTLSDLKGFLDGFQQSDVKRFYLDKSNFLHFRYYSPAYSSGYLDTTVDSIEVVSTHELRLKDVYANSIEYAQLPYDMSYSGIKSFGENPIGFVIGNKSDQYPNNGIKSGYKYELIGQINSTNTLSLSDSAYDLTRDIAVEEIRKEVVLNGTNS